MHKIIAVTNQKGGVGKTTTCVNLAASLVAIKCQVLLIDLDPQGNATMGSGINKTGCTYSINDVLLRKASWEQTLQKTTSGFDITPANSALTMAEVQLLHAPDRRERLRTLLTALRPHYDFILIDCPPSLNMLTINALIAADSVLIPVQCEYYALEGLTDLLNTVKQLKNYHPGLHIGGLLRTMYDGRNKLTLEVSEQLIQHFGNQVYRTVIPRNVRLAEAPSHGLPIFHYDKNAQGAIAYLALASEILQKEESGHHVR